MKSMTAFARAEQNGSLYQMSLEIKTVNHRYLDIQIRMPEASRFLELELRELISKYVSRGRVDVFFKLEPLAQQTDQIHINNDLVQSLYQASNAVGQVFPAINEMNVTDVLKWPGVIETVKGDEKALTVEVLGLFSQCLDDLLLVRQNEGDKTQAFLQSKCQEIIALLNNVKKILPEQNQQLRDKISQKLDELKAEIDQERFEQEVVYHLNRMDVNEEVERLEVHLNECMSLFISKEPVGRKLDFMMQELQREANTLGTKSSLVELKNASLAMKVAIEQIREQVQNIE